MVFFSSWRFDAEGFLFDSIPQSSLLSAAFSRAIRRLTVVHLCPYLPDFYAVLNQI